MADARDEVDRIVDAWLRERPDLDFAPLQVLSRVGRLSRHLDRARRTAFERSDLESWEFDVLAALRRAGSPYQLSPKALLQQTLVSSGTMTNRIDRLVAARPGRAPHRPERRPRHPGADDRRRASAGWMRPSPVSSTRRPSCSPALSPTDQERLSGLLRKLSLGFDEESVSALPPQRAPR